MRAMRMIAGAVWALTAAGGAAGGPAVADDLPRYRLEVRTPQGSGLLPLYLSSSWDQPLPDMVRALIMVHGLARNGNRYFEVASQAAADAGGAGQGTFIVAPQLLLEADIDELTPPPRDVDRLLRWSRSGDWTAGLPARQLPAGASSFDAVDAILARLADRKVFPSLKHVVLAGHSAGGQLVQRYAILGQAPARLGALGLSMRYVVANPSSYAYLSAQRPRSIDDDCRTTFDTWKYGLNALPPYAAGTPVAEFKRAYLMRDVVYLLGTNDDNPSDDNLDRTCEANAQGRNRLARGAAYFADLQQEHPGSAHRLQLVHGVSHSAKGMFTSPCGLAVLFDAARCGWRAARHD
jgi:pimeloyl-ACP methyl ester carboxylesterase